LEERFHVQHEQDGQYVQDVHHGQEKEGSQLELLLSFELKGTSDSCLIWMAVVSLVIPDSCLSDSSCETSIFIEPFFSASSAKLQ